MENYRLLAGIIEAHPNREVLGRMRLQSTVRLLQRIGISTDYTFSIHFHGPYSEELRSDITIIQRLGLGVEQQLEGRAEGESFTIQAVPEAAHPEIAHLTATIHTLAEADPIVLELAAIYDIFRETGSGHLDALCRLRAKKATKCDDRRLEEAMGILRTLGLPAPDAALRAAN